MIIMKIGKDKVVSLCYEVEVDGQIVDKMTSEKPLEYIHGAHMLLPVFEEQILDREPGYKFDFEVSPENGYGVYDEEKRVEIPKSAFEMDGKLREDLLVLGRFLPMLNSMGEVVHGKVVEIKDEAVVMDFNHPMADKTMHFTGEVLAVREATEKELKEGLHGEYLPKGEGCCHHGHGKGCCHGEGHEHGEGCCHGEGHEHGEGCCHGEGHEHGEGCCHGEGHEHGEGCCHKHEGGEGCCHGDKN